MLGKNNESGLARSVIERGLHINLFVYTNHKTNRFPNKLIVHNLMWTRTQSSCEKSIVNALPKVVDFLRVLRFPPTGKVDRGVR